MLGRLEVPVLIRSVRRCVKQKRQSRHPEACGVATTWGTSGSRCNVDRTISGGPDHSIVCRSGYRLRADGRVTIDEISEGS